MDFILTVSENKQICYFPKIELKEIYAEAAKYIYRNENKQCKIKGTLYQVNHIQPMLWQRYHHLQVDNLSKKKRHYFNYN